MCNFDKDKAPSRQEIYLDINSVIIKEDHYVGILEKKVKMIPRS